MSGPGAGGRRPGGPGTQLLLAPPEERADAHGPDAKLLWRLWPYVRPHRYLLCVSLALMPLVAVASLVQPLLIKMAIDAALVYASEERLLQVAALFFAAILGEFLARFGQGYLMQLSGQRVMADLRRSLFRHIQGLRLAYFDRTPIGRITTRVTNDIDSLSELFVSGAVTAVADVITLAGIVGFMLYLDWRLSLVAFVALPPLAVVVEVVRRKARRAFRAIRAKIAELNAFLSEQVQGVAVVQAFGREDACLDEYKSINAAHRDANYRAVRYDALLYSVVESVAAASIAMVLWYAGSRAGLLGDSLAARAYVGTVVAFYEYIQRFFIPIRDLSTKYTIIQSSLAAAERIFGLLGVDERDAPHDPENSPAVPASSAAISFRDVVFAYRQGQVVLPGISFNIRRGEKVALVGATGAGKTTITALVQRLYDVSSGAVIVNGKDVRHYGPGELRRLFAVVPQDVFLFSGTVLSNVALGEQAPDERAVRGALGRVGALETVMGRQGGLGARVAERGSNFSGGERQLIAFARAIYRNPPFLILDEATASIDSETESKLQAAVRELVEGRTSIIVAHRLSTIRNVDRIMVLHRGAVVEEGTHEELLRRNGHYSRLHNLQFSEPAA